MRGLRLVCTDVQTSQKGDSPPKEKTFFPALSNKRENVQNSAIKKMTNIVEIVVRVCKESGYILIMQFSIFLKFM